MKKKPTTKKSGTSKNGTSKSTRSSSKSSDTTSKETVTDKKEDGPTKEEKILKGIEVIKEAVDAGYDFSMKAPFNEIVQGSEVFLEELED